jgi:threonine/homoserine/homoserine lactone efflux protein
MIGLIFGTPAGAVGALTLQRTLSFGIIAGLITGLGSSIADVIYACISVFGITIISDYLVNNQIYINIVGASILLFMGIKMIINSKVKVDNNPLEGNNYFKMFFSSLAVGITNPAAVLSFIFAFSYFGVIDIVFNEKAALVSGIFAGTYLWWLILSCAAFKLKNKINENRLKTVNTLFGIIIILFAFTVVMKVCIK